ncbi:hypothetical protein [Sphingobacterium hungaricum]|uniref:HTH luxR-type domain-containing protein n=1 Tax=Sphingobacterium hungaricum TaxID=2082723 RepID=A0A928UT68_9SPHI|nr:hypothetical protein [Sphingobacterium hungaricum]MBE8712388.1 hypothetical protein [Sphingobacterium hungaricum]
MAFRFCLFILYLTLNLNGYTQTVSNQKIRAEISDEISNEEFDSAYTKITNLINANQSNEDELIELLGLKYILFTNKEELHNVIAVHTEFVDLEKTYPKNHTLKSYKHLIKAYIESSLSHYKEAVEEAQLALLSGEKAKNSKLINQANLQIAQSYVQTGNTGQAIKYANKVYKGQIKDKDYIGQLGALLVLNSCKVQLYLEDKTESNEKRILANLSLLNDLAVNNKEDLGAYNETSVYINVANFYISVNPDYPDAKKLGTQALDKAFATARPMKVNDYLLAHIYNLEYQLRNSNKDPKAIQSLFKGIQALKSSALVNNYMLAYQNLKIAEHYEGIENYKTANKYLREVQHYSDLANSNDQKESLLNNEIYFQSQRSEAEKKLLDEKIDLLNKQKILSFIILFFSIAFGYVTYLYVRKKRDEAVIAKIIAESELVNTHGQLKSIKKEKIKLEKLALIDKLNLDKKTEVLNQISSKNSDNFESNVKKIIKTSDENDKEIFLMKSTLKEIHPDFIDFLMERSNNTLTEIDLKYCSYIHLRFNTVSIASILNVETKSVRMAKYRIKQKLKLDKDLDLNKFLQNYPQE